MAFCGNCGTNIDLGTKRCPHCGQSQEKSAPAQASAAPANVIPTYQPPVMPGAPRQADIQDANDNRTMAILAYIIFLIPLLTGAHKTSPFAKYHTNQGTALFIAALIYGIAYGILTAILAFIPVIGWLLIVVLGLGSFLFLILCIAGILNAANGRMRPLPIIGGIEIIK
jgi:uncharacterized membrane protein